FWLLPVVLVVIETLIFLPKSLRNSSFIPYFMVFWGIRAVLSPLIFFYALRSWVDFNRTLRLIGVHILGFLLFSICFWGLAYLFLHNTILGSSLFDLNRRSTNIGIFGMI